MLANLPALVAPLRYPRRLVTAGIAHIGVGAFHRAHQLDFLDDVLARGDHGWGVRGISLRSPRAETALAPQDGLYVLDQRGQDGERFSVRGALLGVQTAGDDPTPILRTLAAPEISLVTLTLTEKAYVAEPGDFAGQTRPTTAIGFLTLGLAMRRALQLDPFTVVSCDNLMTNGDATHALVLSAAKSLDPGLADWIAEHGAFPNSMVDRITPATTDEDHARLLRETGLEDQGLTVTEPFRQWVIEDRFAGMRPPFEAVGVQMVDDVAPWEAAKLRLLNASHSAMAWLGLLMGLRYVHEAIGWPPMQAFVERLWDEASETLPRAANLDLRAYRKALLDRFDNPSLPHSLLQIAADSSRKLPLRLLPSVTARLDRGEASPALTLAIAAWMTLQRGVSDASDPISIADPLMDAIQPRLRLTAPPEELVSHLLALTDIFPPQLAARQAFAEALTEQYRVLINSGAQRAVETLGAAA